MDKSKPNKQQLIKAERIINDIEGGLRKLIDIFGYKSHKELCAKIHEGLRCLNDIEALSICVYSEEQCYICWNPVFNPIYEKDYFGNLHPYHKRCLYKFNELKKKRHRPLFPNIKE